MHKQSSAGHSLYQHLIAQLGSKFDPQGNAPTKDDGHQHEQESSDAASTNFTGRIRQLVVTKTYRTTDRQDNYLRTIESRTNPHAKHDFGQDSHYQYSLSRLG